MCHITLGYKKSVGDKMIFPKSNDVAFVNSVHSRAAQQPVVKKFSLDIVLNQHVGCFAHGTSTSFVNFAVYTQPLSLF